MQFITRYLSSVARSRRRFSFLFIISLFLLTVLILSNNHDHHQSIDFSQHQNQESLISAKHKSHTMKASITETTKIIEKKGLWPVDEKGRSLKINFLTLDATGFFGADAIEGTHTRCLSSNTTFTWTRQKDRFNEIDFFICHSAPCGLDLKNLPLQLNNEQQQYSMGFIMESEVHSTTGNSWAKYNFIMTYNLDDSYPEPATYFDVNLHIIDLLKPSSISFEEKEKQADIVWIISNCNAHNGREGFVKRLMQEMKVDSYGPCLNNRKGYGARMVDNINAYKKYKFVIAIENSNCVDYVTEKLVKAVESGSIPIVAGRNGRPDYQRFMPEHSYINVYDYKSIKDLANELKRIANNKTLYESYLWYKKHNKIISKLRKLTLDEKIKHFSDVIGSNATIITNGIIAKEKSEDKVCKLIRFVRQTPWQEIAAHSGTARIGSDIACLPRGSLLSYFDSSSSNSNQTIKP
ncbi:unnamed protein product [Rotaria sp. Silwood1]|nr:unnamed protein product [Rotaria sp. Silwood1]